MKHFNWKTITVEKLHLAVRVCVLIHASDTEILYTPRRDRKKTCNTFDSQKIESWFDNQKITSDCQTKTHFNVSLSKNRNVSLSNTEMKPLHKTQRPFFVTQILFTTTNVCTNRSTTISINTRSQLSQEWRFIVHFAWLTRMNIYFCMTRMEIYFCIVKFEFKIILKKLFEIKIFYSF